MSVSSSIWTPTDAAEVHDLRTRASKELKAPIGGLVLQMQGAPNTTPLDEDRAGRPGLCRACWLCSVDVHGVEEWIVRRQRCSRPEFGMARC